jgi:periplasmic protein TonB
MNFARIAIAGSLAVGTTLGLLFLMHSLINTDLGEPEEVAEIRMPDIHMPKTEIDTRYETAKPDRPDEPETPPPDIPEPEFESPDINPEALSMVAPATSGVQLNIGAGFSGDGEFLPIVRVAPVYPTQAAQRGLEGYVIVEFTVTRTGTVRDVFVVESSNRIFERAAVDAAYRFRYRPRIIDGEAIEVPGVQNLFTFVLED